MLWRLSCSGGLATLIATAICASSLDSAYSMAALFLAIGVIAFLSAVLARDRTHVVGFSPWDLLMRFVPNPSWPLLMGLLGTGIAILGVVGIVMV